jgi:hypothetical protein
LNILIINKFHFLELNAYVEPTAQLFNRFFQQWENDSKAKAKATAESMDGAAAKRTSVSGNPKRTSLVVPFSNQNGSGLERRATCRRPSILVSQMKSQPMTLRRNSVIGDFDKIPLSFLLIKRFFGDQAYRDLRLLLDGYEGMELKGLLYWQERLGKLETKLQEVDAFIDVSMEEKRNFTTFTMTIITTLLAPLTILTGYFGMNFENMYELNPETYPSVPGVKLLWLLSGILYLALLILAVHFRIIYSAT